MATFAERKPCAKCEKGAGVTTCDGCQQSFCIKHIVEHRQELAVQMDSIGQEHDTLRRDLVEEDSTHPLLSQIDEWEKKSIMKIQTTANTARNNLRQLLNEMKDNMKSSVDQLANELQERRQSEDYTEMDLTKWSKKLTDIRKLLQTPSNIKIIEDENISTTIRLIKILEQKQLDLTVNSMSTSKETLVPFQQPIRTTQEVFDKAMNPILLSEYGLVATYIMKADYEDYPTIFGKNIYSAGAHNIQFRIENKSRDNFFFGIVTASQKLETAIFKASSANGWWESNIPVNNGRTQNASNRTYLETGDVINLTLDCNNKQIYFRVSRTNVTVQSPIDTTKCPLPWKLAISLSGQHSKLRILS